MDRSQSRRPVGRAAEEAARVQLDEGEVIAEVAAELLSESINGSVVTEAALTEAEEDEATPSCAAADLARRVADRELREELAKNNFTGHRYDEFADALVCYALEVVTAWLVTGEMFRECAKRGYRIGGRPQGWTEHDITGLTGETVTTALIEFRDKGLRGGGWRFDGGASIKTYFITACVYKFVNIYREWRSQQERWSRDLLFAPSDVEVVDAVGRVDVMTSALDKIEADLAYRNLTDRQKSMVILDSLGYTHDEIAELLGEANARVVEGVLYRIRQAANLEPDERGASS